MSANRTDLGEMIIEIRTADADDQFTLLSEFEFYGNVDLIDPPNTDARRIEIRTKDRRLSALLRPIRLPNTRDWTGGGAA